MFLNNVYLIHDDAAHLPDQNIRDYFGRCVNSPGEDSPRGADIQHEWHNTFRYGIDWKNLFGSFIFLDGEGTDFYELLLSELTKKLERKFDWTTPKIVAIEFSSTGDHWEQLPRTNEKLDELQNTVTRYIVKALYNLLQLVILQDTCAWMNLHHIHYNFKKKTVQNNIIWQFDVSFGKHTLRNVAITYYTYNRYRMILYDYKLFGMDLPDWMDLPDCMDKHKYCFYHFEEDLQRSLERIYAAYRHQIKYWTPEQEGFPTLFSNRPRAPRNVHYGSGWTRNAELDEHIQKTWYEKLRIGPWADRKKMMQDAEDEMYG